MHFLNFHTVKEMEYFKQFDIRFGSFTLGQHQMKMEIKRSFFEKYKNDDIKDSDIQVDITVERKETMVSLNFDIHGRIISFCDVCLEDLTIFVSKQEMLILKTTGAAKESDTENIVFVGEKAHSYNVEQVLYEYIVTAMPMRKVHQETGTETCNPDMLKWIDAVNDAPPPQEDERWEVLKKLKFK